MEALVQKGRHAKARIPVCAEAGKVKQDEQQNST